MGLIADIIGSAAKAGGDIMERENRASLELENQKARADYQEELLRKREETARALKQEEEQRQASQFMQAEEEGGKRYSEAQYQKWRSDIGQSDASEEQLRSTYDKAYKGKYQYADKLSEAKRYTVEALKGITADPRMIKSAQDDYKETARSEQAAAESARKERRDEARSIYEMSAAESNARRADASFMQAQAALSRAEKAAAKADSGNLSESERKTYTALMQDAGRRLESANKRMKDAYTPEEKSSVQEEINLIKSEHSTYRGMLFGTQGDKPPAKDAGTKNPSGMTVIGKTPDGRTVYRNADGKQVVGTNK